MKYKVRELDGLSWIVEKEDGDEYYVNYKLFDGVFMCSCKWNLETGKTCRHIRMIKEFVATRKDEFDE
jgi:hypothetical protein